MAIIEINDDTLKTLNPEVYTLRNDLKNKFDNSDFIYVPSINLYVAKEKTLVGEDWFNTPKELHSKNQKMLTILEFIKFLKYTKENYQDIYNEITKVRSPWRAERIDADFKVRGKNLIINYHVFDGNGKIIKKSEILDKDTLMEDKKISLEDYLYNNHTSQGLPNKKVKSGNLYYWAPMRDNNSVARFDSDGGGVGLFCDGDPSCGDSDLGVRAVRHE